MTKKVAGSVKPGPNITREAAALINTKVAARHAEKKVAAPKRIERPGNLVAEMSKEFPSVFGNSLGLRPKKK